MDIEKLTQAHNFHEQNAEACRQAIKSHELVESFPKLKAEHDRLQSDVEKMKKTEKALGADIESRKSELTELEKKYGKYKRLEELDAKIEERTADLRKLNIDFEGVRQKLSAA
jgi:outer membrane murein-binding lipoprotein Lpp